MSAEEFMRHFCPDLTDWQISVLLADARYRRSREAAVWRGRRLSAMRSAYRARRR